mmetsp:Transcript_48800/g.156060  ORF Transcript_48800/g.156060 Transcript_48800/m.156060 type:complete len:159 (-) Transcript_48800:264-740(-)
MHGHASVVLCLHPTTCPRNADALAGKIWLMVFRQVDCLAPTAEDCAAVSSVGNNELTVANTTYNRGTANRERVASPLAELCMSPLASVRKPTQFAKARRVCEQLVHAKKGRTQCACNVVTVTIRDGKRKVPFAEASDLNTSVPIHHTKKCRVVPTMGS